MKNYSHNVIRIKKGKKIINQTYWVIAILNKRKIKSLKIVYKIGYIKLGKKIKLAFDFFRLALLLNKGYILKKSVKKLIALTVPYIHK
jgi:hypothetical protein